MVSIDFQTINSCMEKACYGMEIIYSHFPTVYVTKPSKVIYSIIFGLAGSSCCSSQNIDNFQLWRNGKGKIFENIYALHATGKCKGKEVS